MLPKIDINHHKNLNRTLVSNAGSVESIDLRKSLRDMISNSRYSSIEKLDPEERFVQIKVKKSVAELHRSI